ncbi:unnamed protein product [Caenorhabditis brenneri]
MGPYAAGMGARIRELVQEWVERYREEHQYLEGERNVGAEVIQELSNEFKIHITYSLEGGLSYFSEYKKPRASLNSTSWSLNLFNSPLLPKSQHLAKGLGENLINLQVDPEISLQTNAKGFGMTVKKSETMSDWCRKTLRHDHFSD